MMGDRPGSTASQTPSPTGVPRARVRRRPRVAQPVGDSHSHPHADAGATRAPARRPTVPVVVPTSALPTPEPTTPTNPPKTTPPPRPVRPRPLRRKRRRKPVNPPRRIPGPPPRLPRIEGPTPPGRVRVGVSLFSQPRCGRTDGSPGRNRTYVACPDSKSGGPCQQTNQGTPGPAREHSKGTREAGGASHPVADGPAHAGGQEEWPPNRRPLSSQVPRPDERPRAAGATDRHRSKPLRGQGIRGHHGRGNRPACRGQQAGRHEHFWRQGGLVCRGRRPRDRASPRVDHRRAHLVPVQPPDPEAAPSPCSTTSRTDGRLRESWCGTARPAGDGLPSPALISDIASQVEHILVAQFKSRRLDAKAAPMYAQMLVGMVALTGQWWLENSKVKKDEVAAHLVNLAWNGSPAWNATRPSVGTDHLVRDSEDSSEGKDHAERGARVGGGEAPRHTPEVAPCAHPRR